MGNRIIAMSAFRRAAVAGFAVALSGCYGHHIDHRETISASAGDAQAINRILQIKDPWPRAAWNKRIEHDGPRMVNAVDAYRRPAPVANPNDAALSDIASGPTTAAE
jgi:hypothetical protein